MKFRGGHGLLRAVGSVHGHAPNPKELLVARNQGMGLVWDTAAKADTLGIIGVTYHMGPSKERLTGIASGGNIKVLQWGGNSTESFTCMATAPYF